MIRLCLLPLAFLLMLCSCSVSVKTVRVDPSDTSQKQKIALKSDRSPGRIILDQGTTDRGGFIQFHSDSVSWIQAHTELRMTRHLSELNSISFQQKGARFPKGTVKGMLVGSVAGFLLALLPQPSSDSYEERERVTGSKIVVTTCSGALYGGAIGLISDIASEEKTMYQFVTPANPVIVDDKSQKKAISRME